LSAEKGGELVRNLLLDVKHGEAEGYVNVFNMAEIYYILYRVAPEIVTEKIAHLRLYGLKVIPVDDGELWVAAAKLKGKHSLSLPDAFAVATAEALSAQLVVGSDKELKNLKGDFLRIRD
jgi:predicted nucleic acid-binding protein